MNPSRRTTILTSLLLAMCLSSSVLLLRRVDQVRTGATLEETLYITSPNALKRLSLGYEGLLADIYWTRAVQYFGRKHVVGAQHLGLLAPLLEITTALDPHLIVAYEFGASFLAPVPPNAAGMPDRAIELMQYGMRNNPQEWKLPYQLGFIYYMEKKDYARAAQAFRQASALPGAHPFTKLLAAQMAEHAGDMETARMLWITTYESVPTKEVRANAITHLRALRADEDVTQLGEIVARYGQKTGKLPPSMSALVAAGLLHGIPVDPDGHPYKLMPDGRIEVRNPDDFPFIRKGMPLGYTPPLSPKLKSE